MKDSIRGLPVLDVLVRDLRYTFRTLSRDSGFALIAVLILALGIGANIAVFSVVNTILLRPLPFPDAQRLVRIVEKNAASNESSKTYTADATQDFQRQNHSFESVSGYFAFTPPDNVKLVGNGQPAPVTGLFVAEGFFQTLGVEPSLGRLFSSEEFVQHAPPAVLLSNPFWKRHFGGDRSIIGCTINLDGDHQLGYRERRIPGITRIIGMAGLLSPGKDNMKAWLSHSLQRTRTGSGASPLPGS